ncbi:Crp/Fnr family transcriptional regulator [Nocardia sp. NPDC004604]|uniref:Crp/Fnr family transcriptional regulator n=1 Tax=Nocardia sp. NPDC004604 TaxID=3157013 RepID=UPI00339FA4C9
MEYSSASLSSAVLTAWSESFLAELPGETRDVLLRDATTVTVSAGSVIYQPFGPARLALLHRGQARVKVLAKNGRAATIRYAGPGDLIGLPSAIASGANETAEAVTDCQASMLNVATVRRVASTDARVAWLFAHRLAKIVFEVVEFLSDDVFDTVQQRVSRHLLDLAANSPDGLIVGVDQQVLADSIGSVREVVARELKKLRDSAIIERHPDGLRINAPERLHRIADNAGNSELAT